MALRPSQMKSLPAKWMTTRSGPTLAALPRRKQVRFHEKVFTKCHGYSYACAQSGVERNEARWVRRAQAIRVMKMN